MRQLLFVGLFLSLATIGCGPNALRVRAEDNVRTASEALLEVRSSGGEDVPGLAPVLDESDLWLRRAEHAIDTWDGDRSFAYETVAPCLARSLRETREALQQAGRPVPESLGEAEAQASDAVDAACPRPAQTPASPAPQPPSDAANPAAPLTP